MTAISAGAASGVDIDWLKIDWNRVGRAVKRLQIRIAKAIREKFWNKANALQWILTHSFYGKLLAVKRVTEKPGKRTSGVDRVVWSTPRSKVKAVKLLSRRGYQPSLLKRVYIPKANGKNVHWAFRRCGIGPCRHSTCWLCHRLRKRRETGIPTDFDHAALAERA